MNENDIYLLIDFKCPLCGTEQAYTNVSYTPLGNRCCCHCGYIFPELYIGKLFEEIRNIHKTT